MRRGRIDITVRRASVAAPASRDIRVHEVDCGLQVEEYRLEGLGLYKLRFWHFGVLRSYGFGDCHRSPTSHIRILSPEGPKLKPVSLPKHIVSRPCRAESGHNYKSRAKLLTIIAGPVFKTRKFRWAPNISLPRLCPSWMGSGTTDRTIAFCINCWAILLPSLGGLGRSVCSKGRFFNPSTMPVPIYLYRHHRGHPFLGILGPQNPDPS